MSIDEALRLLLIGSAGNAGKGAALSALVGGRVFSHEADESAIDPKIVFHCISAPGEYTQDGDSGLGHPRFQVDCMGLTPASVKALAEAVRANVSGFAGTVGGLSVQGVFIVDEATFNYAAPGASANVERGYRLDLVLWHARQ